ncbi:tetratricopeptide repeat protein [Belnapia rosea]|uniref:TPR repeat-containing protein n=1 Tax=Belnapia rosea TaxID=938405 RepID=A0A1G6M3Q3_9PROT|nr:tetratricopeptide repeat protein [Belnapia rosea]SDC49586.1 TPR repeat-containing protein [Belnapia rosea]
MPRMGDRPMRRRLLSALLSGTALVWSRAQTQAQTQAPARPDARKAELDRAFDALRTAPNEAGAALVEARIRALWAQGASPAAALLLRRGARNLEARLSGEALEDFDAAITLAPEFADAWFLRAQAYLGAGDPAAAARDLQEVLRLEPRHWPALVTLSAIQDQAGDARGALRSLSAALGINPQMPGGAARLREQRRKAEGEAT